MTKWPTDTVQIEYIQCSNDGNDHNEPEYDLGNNLFNIRKIGGILRCCGRKAMVGIELMQKLFTPAAISKAITQPRSKITTTAKMGWN
jgi:hypothetical protein